MDQSNLFKNLVNLAESKDKKRNTFESVNALYESRELILNAFKSEISPIKETQGKRLKILTPKQKFQRLPITLAQVKADNTSENLLHEIRQIIYSLHGAKEINIMNSIKV